MKLQIENNSSSEFINIPSDVSSANGSAEVTEMLRKGIKAAQEGKRAEARHLLMQVTEREPKNENGWLWLASISEYPEELLIFLSNVLNINPKNERALEWEKSTKSLLSKTFVQRGIEASKESQSAFAKQSFLQAIVHDDQNEMAWLWLASISDTVEEKKSHLQKVLNINPNNETALNLLKSVKTEMAQALLEKAKVEAFAGGKESAQKMLSDILNHAPELEDAWILKSFLTDSFSEKMNLFEKVLEINADNEVAVSCLQAMRSVSEKTAPKASFNDSQNSVSVERVEAAEFAAPETLFIEPLRIESVSVEEHFSEKSFTVQTVKDYSFSADSAQPAKVAEQTEEDSPQQTDSVENLNGWKADFSEDSQDEEMEMTAIFSEGGEENEAEAFYAASETPAYPEEEVEENQYFEVQKDVEETPVEELQYFEDAQSVEEKSLAADESADEVDKPETQKLEEKVFLKDAKHSDLPADSVAQTEEFRATAEEKLKGEMISCPFCSAENEPQNFICHSCRAMLTISDLEMLLAYQEADVAMLQPKVEEMEAENKKNKLDAQGLKMLGIGLINLKNTRKGFEYLQEAAYLDPNDLLLNSQVNSLAIRLSEIEEQKSNHASMPKNKTILVVDDSATVRKLISGKLEKCGHEVICAVDGMDALEKMNESLPDLVLLDITMPRMDGYQVCKLIRGNETTKEIPVVMISGKDGFFDKVRGRMAGTSGYITKPFGPETLMKTVESYID